MPKFEITVHEVLSHTFTVEAKDEEEVYDKGVQMLLDADQDEVFTDIDDSTVEEVKELK